MKQNRDFRKSLVNFSNQPSFIRLNKNNMAKKKSKFKRFSDYDCDGGCPYESPEDCTVCLNRKK